MLARLTEQLKRHEGFRQFPYRDSMGILTIGYGRNLVSRGISEEEASMLLANDIRDADAQLKAALPVYRGLSDTRQAVLVNMTINLGIRGLLKFKRMIAALNAGDYQKAAAEMEDSDWFKQVGRRAVELCAIMRDDREGI